MLLQLVEFASLFREEVRLSGGRTNSPGWVAWADRHTTWGGVSGRKTALRVLGREAGWQFRCQVLRTRRGGGR